MVPESDGAESGFDEDASPRSRAPDGGASRGEPKAELSIAIQLAALLESSEDAVVVVSRDGRITHWSDGAERVFGYARDEALGQNIAVLSPPAGRAQAELLLRRVLAGEKVERMRTERVTRDGRALAVSLLASAITGPTGEVIGVAAIVRDVTAQKRAEEELQVSNEVYRTVVEALEEGVVVQSSTGRILAANPSAVAMLGLPESELIGRTSSVGGVSAEGIVRLVHEDGSPFTAEERPAIVSMRTGEPQYGVIVGAEKLDGSISWLSINGRPLYRSDEQEPYAAVSSITDITEMRTTLNRLDAARIEDLKRLALAAEYRDDATHGHTERVAVHAERIARELSMDDGWCATIRRAAPLHDIGKLGIPDRILLKPGPLTSEEFAEMKAHTTIGARILGDSDYPVLAMGREIALTHHERSDGAGYPAGLKAEEIPLAGRIVAVADVFDAITHERPYKPARSREHAIGEITRDSGHQFDTRVVTAFLTVNEWV